MARRIFLVGSIANPDRLLSKVQGGGLFIYAGENIERFKIFEYAFRGRLNALAYQEYHAYINSKRRSFIEWMESNHNVYGDNPSYWFSTTFSANPYSSRMFLYCMNIALFQDIMIKHPEKDIVFIAESYAVLLTAKNIARGNLIHEIGVFREKMRLGRSLLCNLLKGVIRFFYLYLLRYLMVRSIPKEEPVKKIDMVFDSYLFENSFDTQGVFKNRYFAELHDFLKNSKIRSAVYPCFHEIRLKNLKSVLKHVRKSRVKFILLEDYLKFKDYIGVLFYPVHRFRNLERVQRFLGIDVQKVVNEENWLDLTSFSFILPYLMYNFPKRLSESGITPRIYMHWSEGQTIHKASVMGFHRYLPATKVVGGKIFVPSQNHLSLFITESQRDKGVAPDIVITSGTKLRDIFSIYDKNGDYSVGSSLRYAYLWDIVRKKRYPESSKTVIVFLPYHREISKYTMSLIAKALRRAVANGSKVIIKVHPTISRKDTNFLFNLDILRDKQVEVSFADSKSVLPEASAIITFESSVTAEAACLGIPIVLVGIPIGLDLNLHDYIPKPMCRIGYNDNDIDLILNEWALKHPLSLEERREMGAGFLRVFFEPVTDQLLKVYLGDNPIFLAKRHKSNVTHKHDGS